MQSLLMTQAGRAISLFSDSRPLFGALPLADQSPVTTRNEPGQLFRCGARSTAIVLKGIHGPFAEEVVSRIWQALREAERERKRAKSLQQVPGIEEPQQEQLSEGATPALDEPERRNGLRHSHKVTLLIYGSNSDRQPFHEESETIDANESGCLLTLENIVSKGQRLFLSNTQNQAERECRVVYIGKRSAGKARVGVEFLKPSPQFWSRA
jgi:hypothetical protein